MGWFVMIWRTDTYSSIARASHTNEEICDPHCKRDRLGRKPALVALAGWSYIFVTSGWIYVAFGLAVLASGMVAFALWRARQRS